MGLCRFIPNACTLQGLRKMLLIHILFVLYKSHSCQAGCQPSTDEEHRMCFYISPHKAQVDILSEITKSHDIEVKDCPKMCTCQCAKSGQTTLLFILNCHVDPSYELPKLLHHYTEVYPLLLYLANASLSTFPCEILVLTQLRILQIIHSPMQMISCDLSALTRLGAMQIQYTRLDTVPSQLFTALPSLLVLDMSNNAINTVSVPASRPNTVTILRLNNNKITKFPKGILELSSLVWLELANNKLRKVPALSPLSMMSMLNLSHNVLGNLHLNLSDLPKLKCLDLSHTNRSHIDKTLLPNTLHALYLSHNYLTTIPVVDLEDLDYLDLSHNMLKVIPSEIGKTVVTRLDLSHNELTSLYQPSFKQNLACLDQSHNKIDLLPYVPGMFHSLKMLLLDYNKVEQVTIFRDLRPVPGLVYVDLSHNMLTSLDSWPLRLVHANPNIQVSIDSNSIETFTNHGAASFRSCDTILYGKISLKHNKISHIVDIFNGWNLTGGTLDQLQTCLDRVSLYLSGNPLVCDCLDYVIYSHIHKSKHWGLSCSKPSRLSGMDPLNIPLDSFTCPVHKDCPKGCTCIKSPHTKSIQLMCNQYMSRDLPGVIPQLPGGSSYHLDFANQNLWKVSFRGYLQKSSKALLSHNAITEISKEALLELVNVEVVHLDNNMLVHLSDNIMSVTLNMTKVLTLSNNLWLCDCQALAMRDWVMQNSINIPDANSIICNSPKSTSKQRMIFLESSVFCPKPISLPLVILAIAVTIAAIIFIASMVRKYWLRHDATALLIVKHFDPVPGFKPTFQLPPRDECEGEKKEFDVYVSYDDGDEEYILEWLIPQLEKRGFKVCLQRANQDWCLSLIDNHFMLMDNSKRVLVFLSHNLINSDMGLFEWNTAYDMDISYGMSRLVTILDRDVDVNNLEYIQRQYFSVRASIVRGETYFWRNLIYALAIQRMGEPATVHDEEEVEEPAMALNEEEV